MSRQLKKRKIDTVSALLIAIIVIGIGLLAYPSVADYWNSFHQSQAIMAYQEQVTKIDTSHYKRLLEEAAAYNSQFKETGVKWHMTDEEIKVYNKLLSVDDTGNMGYITIPKINVTLPLYHGISEDVLQTSIGHLEGTSLPVGGDSTHSVLSGHRGLPSAKLFSDLDKLKVGDRWTVSILNETYTYEVDQIRTVLPKDLEEARAELKIQKEILLCPLRGWPRHS